MKKSILIFVITINGVLNSLAQGMFMGSVVDEKKEPIIYATVLAYKNNILKGTTVTDLIGKFEIKELDSGLYSIIALSAGYDSSVIKGLIIDNNKITHVRFILKPHKVICFPKVIREYTVPLIDIDNPSKRTYTREEINQMPH